MIEKLTVSQCITVKVGMMLQMKSPAGVKVVNGSKIVLLISCVMDAQDCMQINIRKQKARKIYEKLFRLH